MIRRILIFENNRSLAKRLQDALTTDGIESITLASSMRETLMALDEQTFDLAIIPAVNSRQHLRPIQALQPNLPVLLTSSSLEEQIPAGIEQAVLGILHFPHLRGELPALLARIEEWSPSPVSVRSAEPKKVPEISLRMLTAICDAFGPFQGIQQSIFSRGNRVLATGGNISQDEAKEIVNQVVQSWDEKRGSVDMRYWQKPSSSDSVLLFTRVAGDAHLTLVATPETPIEFVQDIADQVVRNMAGIASSREKPAQVWPRQTTKEHKPQVASEIAHFESKKTDSISRTNPLSLAIGAVTFLIRRIAFGVLILLAIVLLTFFGLNMARGMDFGEAALDAFSDTGSYLQSLSQGDLGMSTAGSNSLLAVPVSQVIAERLPRSLGLLGISLVAAAIPGIFLGIQAARRRSARSMGIIVATIVGVSVPSFFAAFLLQWIFITYTQKVGRSLLPVGGFGWDAHLIIPVLVLAARPLAQITRITFVSISDILQEDYIRTAHSKGLRRYQVMYWHVLRNAAVPILTTVGVSLRFALSSLPVVEMYFGWPGVGFSLLGAIAKRDDNLTVGLVLCLGIMFIVVNLLLELSYRLIDPRISQRPAHLVASKQRNLLGSIQSFFDEIRDYLSDNALTRQLKRREADIDDDRFKAILSRADQELEVAQRAASSVSRPSLWKAAWRNFPLVAGSILVIGLLVVVLAGPWLAPHDPYTTRGLELVDGQIEVPPFAPGESAPWGTDALGRDMASLILIGAQLTLTLALLVVVARMLVGVIMGAIAGWSIGGWLDRSIMGLAEIVSSFPALLLAMILILALGIRQGLWPFIVGLGFVGWGEIMQFVRGEVASIRPRSFIESAVAIGARVPRIISRHILPNLLSPLISIFALEMGATLMLLGELGFLGIFIGGGAFAELEIWGPLYHYSDVPEWGALLSNIRTYSRSYPWLALYPTLAFFISILGFNLFGEGIRRLVDEGSLIINKMINRYTIAFSVLVAIIVIWLQSNSGAVAFYRQHASEFDGEVARSIVSDLTEPGLEGRALGSDGIDQAATYIADRFKELGVQPAGERTTYFQTRSRSFGRVNDIPDLELDDGSTPLEYGVDFAPYPGRYVSMGEIAGPIRYVGLGDPTLIRGFGGNWRYPDLRTANFSDEILLALSSREAIQLQFVPHGGLLVVVDDAELLKRRITQPGRTQEFVHPGTGRQTGEDAPSLWITKEVADRILAPTGKTVEELREESADFASGEITQIEVGGRAHMNVDGTLEKRWSAMNVIGYIPGVGSLGGSEVKLDHKMIVVMAQYDSPPVGPEDFDFPAANDNASGVALMLETIRVIQETEYEPKKTFLFVAYSGEGLEGGENVSSPDVFKILQAKIGFASAYELEAIITLRGVGGGSGDRLEVSTGGSLRLAELFEAVGRQVGAKVIRRDEPIDISIIYTEGSPAESGQEAPEIQLSWEGWDQYSRLSADSLETISAETMQDAGQTLSLALMIMGRERQY